MGAWEVSGDIKMEFHNFMLIRQRRWITKKIASITTVVFNVWFISYFIHYGGWPNFREDADFYLLKKCELRDKLMIFQKHICRLETHKTSTTPSCSGLIPAQKSRGNSVLGVVFSHTKPNMNFVILIVLVEKKHTKLIYHMPWLYQYPPLPFQRSYKN